MQRQFTDNGTPEHAVQLPEEEEREEEEWEERERKKTTLDNLAKECGFMKSLAKSAVPANDFANDFIKPKRANKWQTQTRRFNNCVSSDIVERSPMKNSKRFPFSSSE